MDPLVFGDSFERVRKHVIKETSLTRGGVHSFFGTPAEDLQVLLTKRSTETRGLFSERAKSSFSFFNAICRVRMASRVSVCLPTYIGGGEAPLGLRESLENGERWSSMEALASASRNSLPGESGQAETLF